MFTMAIIVIAASNEAIFIYDVASIRYNEMTCSRILVRIWRPIQARYDSRGKRWALNSS